jgi:hypothetical protein
MQCHETSEVVYAVSMRLPKIYDAKERPSQKCLALFPFKGDFKQKNTVGNIS